MPFRLAKFAVATTAPRAPRPALKSWRVLPFALALAACTTQTFPLRAVDESAPSPSVQVHQQRFFIGGLGQEATINAVKACVRAERVVAVETHRSVNDVLLGLLTLGLYSPAHAVVSCR